MAEEQKLSVVDMIRRTGHNTAEFMEKVAAHIEQLEYEVVRLNERVNQLESQNGKVESN
jgi:uncharacterized protein YceH (UPF0502 family)